MNLSKYISWKRLGLIIKSDILNYYSFIWIMYGAAFGILLINAILWSFTNEDMLNFHLLFFPMTLFFYGAIITSMAFPEMHNGRKSHFYLTLPASLEEKLISRLVLTSIIFSILTLIFYSISVYIIRGICSIWGGAPLPVFSMGSSDTLLALRIYMVIHAIFLFSSIYFNRLSLIKLILTLSAFAIVLAIFVLISLRLIFSDFFESFSLILKPDLPTLEFDTFFSTTTSIIWPVIKFIFWCLLAPLFWIMTLLRLKEKEV